MPKHKVGPYESLMAFVNEKEITQENWQAVLDRFESRLPDECRDKEGRPEVEASRDWVETYSRLGFRAPRELRREPIAGPEPLLEVQHELRKDFTRLIESCRLPLIEEQADTRKTFENNFQKAHKEAVQQGRKDAFSLAFSQAQDTLPPLPDLSWLDEKVHGFTVKFKLEHNSLVLIKERPFFYVIIDDLRNWIYFRLAHLWADGLIYWLKQCEYEKCQRFYLAKTERQNRSYCSQRCAQSVTAADRTKASRVRRIIWENRKQDLQKALDQTKTLQQTTRQEALWQVEQTLKNAEQAFEAAYRRGKGNGFTEGEAFLARAKKQLRRFHK